MATEAKPCPSKLPRLSTQRIALRVTPAAERALKQGHPWLYEEAIRQQSKAGQPGDLAIVFDRKGRFLAVGLYDPTSVIQVRVLQVGQPMPIDANWFQARLAAAVQRRAPLLETDTTGYRLVHGENDGLPGLVIDRYAATLVAKLYTAAWIPHLNGLLAALIQTLPAERLVLRLGRAVRRQPDYLHGLADGMVLAGQALTSPLLFRENGLTFAADPLRGQKTGFFLDQRDNRARVEKLAAGRRVLDVFAYTGGFSVYAARGGAQSVTSVDMSAAALALASRNFALNQQVPAVAAASHERVAQDAFEALARFASQKRRFDLVILDPPAFARKQTQIERALAAYRRLTRLGLAVLAPGGILVQASCSSRVPADAFFAAIHQAAQRSGRSLREIERTGHPLDHPVTFPEGAYLKCLFAITPS